MKNFSQITVNLQQREDKNRNTYFVGHIHPDELPVKDAVLDLSDGVVFLIWPHLKETRNAPQMAIKRMAKRNGGGGDDEDYDEYDDYDDGRVGGGRAWSNER